LLDAQVESVTLPGAAEPGTRKGIDAFSRAVEQVFEGWETWRMEPERFAAVGEQVAVVVRYQARGRASGVEVDGRESALWTVKDGDEALRAAETRESSASSS
jgi:ketosteroid isomerase-like protein